MHIAPVTDAAINNMIRNVIADITIGIAISIDIFPVANNPSATIKNAATKAIKRIGIKMKKIIGRIIHRVIFIGDKELLPQRSQAVWNHSPDGFNWSYNGSGPAQLALGLLLEAGLDEETAVKHHQSFKFDVIARLPAGDFEIEWNVVEEWIENNVR